MNCQKAGDLLSAYIEGEVTGRQCEALDAHLEGCAGCREELDTLRSALALLAAPKTLVRPEGLLEEFKAKYLPEAEAAPAPSWGIKIPVLPKIEWPSLSRLMLPMGGMAAAAAAAALVVALHGGHPGAAGTAQSPSSPRLQVAQNTTPPAVTPAGPVAVLSAPAVGAVKSTPVHGAARETAAAKPRTRRSAPAHANRMRLIATLPVDRPVHRSVETHRSTRHRSRHSTGIQYARAQMAVPPVTGRDLDSLAKRHGEVELSPELRWKELDGQGGAIMHKASASVAEDGYAEASCKNVATGEVVRSAAVSIPAEAAPAVPVSDGADKNN